MTRKRSLALVLNDDAADNGSLAEGIGRLQARGHRLELLTISQPGEGVLLAARAAKSGVDTVVACGGDGTLNEVVTGLFRSGTEDEVAVAVIPFGTGNDFAASAGIPEGDPVAALELILSQAPVPIDAAQCGSRPFVNVASGGFPAEISREVAGSAKTVLGRFAYALTGLANVVRLAGRPVRLRGPGLDWSGELYGLAVGNGRLAGGGFQVCPRALLDDGALDVVVVPEEPDAGLLDLLRDHQRLKAAEETTLFETWRVPWLELEAPEGLQINLDGQPVEGQRFRFEILPLRLRFHLPPTAPLSGSVVGPEP